MLYCRGSKDFSAFIFHRHATLPGESRAAWQREKGQPYGYWGSKWKAKEPRYFRYFRYEVYLQKHFSWGERCERCWAHSYIWFVHDHPICVATSRDKSMEKIRKHKLPIQQSIPHQWSADCNQESNQKPLPLNWLEDINCLNLGCEQ